MAANFEELRRREKLHVEGVALQRIGKRALIYDYRIEAIALGLNSAGQSYGPRPDDYHVTHPVPVRIRKSALRTRGWLPLFPAVEPH